MHVSCCIVIALLCLAKAQIIQVSLSCAFLDKFQFLFKEVIKAICHSSIFPMRLETKLAGMEPVLNSHVGGEKK